MPTCTYGADGAETVAAENAMLGSRLSAANPCRPIRLLVPPRRARQRQQ